MQILTTEDGSHTLKNLELNETYHSIKGAYNESMHVYIQEGLKKLKKYKISVLEIGMGTGLNAMLTLIHRTTEQSIEYTAIEPYPLELPLIKELNYFKDTPDQEIFEKIHEQKQNTIQEIEPGFVLEKIQEKIQDFETEKKYHIIYFDAFAPLKQPNMWTTEIFEKLHYFLEPKGLLVTYCAQGKFKRDLQDLGFRIESPAGPNGKREITRAVKK